MSSISNIDSHRPINNTELSLIRLGIAVTVSMVACYIFKDYPAVCVPILCLVALGCLYGRCKTSELPVIGSHQYRVCNKGISFEDDNAKEVMDLVKRYVKEKVVAAGPVEVINNLFTGLFYGKITNLSSVDNRMTLYFSSEFEVVSDDPGIKTLVIPEKIVFSLSSTGVVFDEEEAPFERREFSILKVQTVWSSIEFANGSVCFNLQLRFGPFVPMISGWSYQRRLNLSFI